MDSRSRGQIPATNSRHLGGGGGAKRRLERTFTHPAPLTSSPHTGVFPRKTRVSEGAISLIKMDFLAFFPSLSPPKKIGGRAKWANVLNDG